MYSRDGSSDLIDLPLLILVNKKDNASFRGLDAVKQSLFLNEIYCNKTVEVQAMSAFKGEGIDTALTWIYEHIPLSI